MTYLQEEYSREKERGVGGRELGDGFLPATLRSCDANVNVNSREHNREAPNALCTLVEREKKSFQLTTKSVNRTRRISKVVW